MKSSFNINRLCRKSLPFQSTASIPEISSSKLSDLKARLLKASNTYANPETITSGMLCINQMLLQQGIDISNSSTLEIISFCVRVWRAGSTFDIVLAAFDFVRHTFSADTITSAVEYIAVLMKTLFHEFVSSITVESAETPISDFFQSHFKSIDDLKNSSFFANVRTFILSIVTLRFFDAATSRKLQRNFHTEDAPKGEMDAILQICQCSIKLLRFGERMHNGDKLSVILASDDPAEYFIEEAKHLIANVNYTYSGLPIEGYTHHVEFYSRVGESIKSANMIIQNLPKRAHNYRTVCAYRMKLMELVNTYKKRLAGESRITPYAIKLVGSPGVGKSSVFDMICRFHSHVLNREYSEEYVFHRNIASDYWEGYNPLCQDVIHYSEAGNSAHKIAESTRDAVLAEMTSLIDSLPMTVDMASVEGKGTTYASPTLVIADINNANMNANLQVNNPAAFHRRFVTIDVRVKPEFRVDSGMQLDSAKAYADGSDNYWLFTVKYTLAATALKHDDIVVLKDVDIFEMFKWLKGNMQKHYASQSAIVEKRRNINISDFDKTTPVTESALFDMEYLSGIDIPEVRLNVYDYFKITYDVFNWAFFTIFYYLLGFPLFCKLFFPFAIIMIRNHIKAKGDYHYNRIRVWMGYKSPVPLKATWKHQAVIHGLTAVVTGIVTYKALTKFLATMTSDTQGMAMSKVSDATEEEIEESVLAFEKKVGVSRPRDFHPTENNDDWFSRDCGHLFKMCATKRTADEPEKVARSAARNVRHFQITSVSARGITQTIKTCGLGIMGDVVLINAHAANGNPIFKVAQYDRDHAICIRRVQVTNFVKYGSDGLLFRIPGDQFRDIRELILPKFEWGEQSRHTIIGYPTDLHETRSVWNGDLHSNHDGLPYLQKETIKYEWADHRVGVCGTPILVQAGRAFGIAAFHCAGNSKCFDGFGQTMDKESISAAVDQLHEASPYIPINSEGALRVETPREPHPRSAIREVCAPRVRYLGTTEEPIIPTKSKLIKAPTYKIAELVSKASITDENGEEIYGPPRMKGIKLDGVYYAPYHNFYRKLRPAQKGLDDRIMGKVIKTLVKHITTKLEAKGITSLSPCSMHVAVNGYRDNAAMNSMKGSTSGGYPWKGPKKKFNNPAPTEDLPEAQKPNADVASQLLWQIRQYAQHRNANPLLGAQLKDEARTAKKNKTAKTRVFMMSPYEATILQRIMLLPFYSLMIEHRDIFMTAIGINMHSKESEELYNKLVEFSKKLMEGDYGGFDTSMPVDIGAASNSVVYEVLKYFGYSKESLDVVRGLFSDGLHPTVVVEGDVVQVPGLQPSGKYATAEDNSLRGLIMLMYFYASQFPERDLDTFFEEILAAIYGDDLLAAVKESSQDKFNNVTYAEFCKEVYGIEYTNAQKTKDFEKFLRPDQVSFLKRTFVFSKCHGGIVAPLDRTSIMKSVAYMLPSKSVSIEDQCRDSVVSAMREMYFHMMPKEYDEHRFVVAKEMDELFNLPKGEFIKSLPSWRELYCSIYNKDGEDIVTESNIFKRTLAAVDKDANRAIYAWQREVGSWMNVHLFLWPLNALLLATCENILTPLSERGYISDATGFFLCTVFIAPILEELWFTPAWNRHMRLFVGFCELVMISPCNLLFHTQLGAHFPTLTGRILAHSAHNFVATMTMWYCPPLATPIRIWIYTYITVNYLCRHGVISQIKKY